MNSPLHSIVYVSLATRPFSSEDLRELLSQSQARNQAADITGMLLFKDGCFIQAFEGEEAAVRALRHRIERDPRHRNIVVLMDGPIDRRDFSAWTMGFKDLSDEDVQRQPGFSEMLKMFIRQGRCSMDTSFAIKLLRSFAQ